MPLQHCDADHGAHHPDQADLQPSLTTQTVEEEDRYPSRDEEHDSDSACGKVGGLGIGDAAFLKKAGLRRNQRLCSV